MTVRDVIMSQPLVYRLWMAPFADKKFAPIVANNNLEQVRRVLDVGCGPGTNALYFSSMDYLGIDLNPEYIEDARRRYARPGGRVQFEAADASKFVAPPGEKFDFALLNSFLHHVSDEVTRSILANVARLLTDDGHVHILELILPEGGSVARFLAKSDRGEHPRPLEKWRALLAESFETELFEPYDLGIFGIALWKMVYFKGRGRR